jgi:hypothetical protein
VDAAGGETSLIWNPDRRVAGSLFLNSFVFFGAIR